MHDSDIIQTSGNPAIRASGGSAIEFWLPATHFDGKNKIKGEELYADGNAIIKAGDGSNSTSNNHFCDAAAATLRVGSGGTIYAKYDYWPNGSAPTQINNGGSIFYSNNLGSSDCSGLPSMIMASTFNITELQNLSTVLEDLLFEAIGKTRDGFYADASTLFIQVIQSGEMPVAHTALLELARLSRKWSDASIPAFIDNLSKTDGTLKATAMKMLADIYMFQDNQTEALQLLNDILTTYPDTPDAFFAHLSIFFVYFEMGDYQNAEAVLDAIKPLSDEEVISVEAARQLLSLETGVNAASTQLHKAETEIKTSESLFKKSFQLFHNYPNPFNPEIRIRYQLTEPSFVELKVFNVRGHEVKRLEHGQKPAGEYSVVWNARDNFGRQVSSGTYIYKITVEPLSGKGKRFEQSRKLVLLQ